jgi:hypothetical protein
MERREFLRLAAAGTAGLAVPPWIARAFFGEPIDPAAQDGSTRLDEALHRAITFGKPLLVLVVPVDLSEANQRGTLFGGLLNTVGDDALAVLALCEVVCATVAQVRRVVGEDRFEEPLMILLEPASLSILATPIDPELPPARKPFMSHGDCERAARNRIEIAARAIHDAVAPDSQTISRRAEVAGTTLSPEEISRLAEVAGGDFVLATALADRGAAVLYRIGEEDPSRRPCVIEILARAAIARLVLSPPRGSKWALTSGCDFWFEDGTPKEMLRCGMALVPIVSQRFLRFFVEG